MIADLVGRIGWTGLYLGAGLVMLLLILAPLQLYSIVAALREQNEQMRTQTKLLAALANDLDAIRGSGSKEGYTQVENVN